eukprot:IDg14310t1
MLLCFAVSSVSVTVSCYSMCCFSLILNQNGFSSLYVPTSSRGTILAQRLAVWQMEQPMLRHQASHGSHNVSTTARNCCKTLSKHTLLYKPIIFPHPLNVSLPSAFRAIALHSTEIYLYFSLPGPLILLPLPESKVSLCYQVPSLSTPARCRTGEHGVRMVRVDVRLPLCSRAPCRRRHAHPVRFGLGTLLYRRCAFSRSRRTILVQANDKLLHVTAHNFSNCGQRNARLEYFMRIVYCFRTSQNCASS